MATRETAGSLGELWEARVFQRVTIADVVARLVSLSDVPSKGSRSAIELLVNFLGDDQMRGSHGEAAIWGLLISGWSFGHPPLPLMADLARRYPLAQYETVFCPHCGGEMVLDGGPTECGFCS